VPVEVGLGFDHWDDVRRGHLGRRDTHAEYERAASILRECPNIVPATFVAGGGVFTTEREGIEGATLTAENVLAVQGGGVVWVEPFGAQPGTIQERLQSQGRWQPIRCWSIIEILRQVAPNAREAGAELRVGEFQFPATSTPSNRCPVCDDDGRFIEAFRGFTETQDPNALQVNCDECQADWERNLDVRLVRPGEIERLIAEYDTFAAMMRRRRR
jgi:uncharacterized Fe-S cluster-containing MiaB family protein